MNGSETIHYITYRLFLFWKRKADYYTMENGPWISIVNVQRSRTHCLQTNTSLCGIVLEFGTHVSANIISNNSLRWLSLTGLACDKSTIIRGFSPNPSRNAPILKEVIIMKRILAAINMKGQPTVAMNPLRVTLCPVRLKLKRPPSYEFERSHGFEWFLKVKRDCIPCYLSALLNLLNRCHK